MTGDPTLTLSRERDPKAEAVVTGGLHEFNKAASGRVDSQDLDVLVRDSDTGEIVGALLGHSSLGLFFLDLFYLPEHLRGAGHGSRIIALAEDEARQRGCTAAFVYTVTLRRAFTSGTATVASARSLVHPPAPSGFFSARRSCRSRRCDG